MSVRMSGDNERNVVVRAVDLDVGEVVDAEYDLVEPGRHIFFSFFLVPMVGIQSGTILSCRSGTISFFSFFKS